jgi:thioredoxin 1
MKTLSLILTFAFGIVACAADAPPLPRLVDVGAGQCIPCKQMKPILEELTREYAGQMEVTFIDVWENKAAGEPYRIRMIPTQIFFSAERKELFRHEGFISKKDILAKWKELGVDLKATSVKTNRADGRDL